MGSQLQLLIPFFFVNWTDCHLHVAFPLHMRLLLDVFYYVAW